MNSSTYSNGGYTYAAYINNQWYKATDKGQLSSGGGFPGGGGPGGGGGRPGSTYYVYELDIDTWPGIPTYVEVEGKSEDDLNNILNKLGYSMKDTVSCTADDIYRKYGKSMFDSRELKF